MDVTMGLHVVGVLPHEWERVAVADDAFWLALDRLVETSTLVIDRPRGSTHPRYADFQYPLDYGFLDGTRSGDGHGIDVWVGSEPAKRVTAVILTLDLLKRDAEPKVLLGCTPDERRSILAIHLQGAQSAILIERE